MYRTSLIRRTEIASMLVHLTSIARRNHHMVVVWIHIVVKRYELRGTVGNSELQQAKWINLECRLLCVDSIGGIPWQAAAKQQQRKKPHFLEVREYNV